MVKKIIIVMLMVCVSILAACSSTATNLEKVESVPKFVQDSIQPNVQLQLKEEDKNSYYITLQSDGDADFNYDVKGDIVEIKFDVSDSDTEQEKQTVYHLTIDKDITTIDVYVNGEHSGFDITS
ncbi:MAG TPA: LamG domain-containing protein [Candidatus Enterococcus avicola]|uniref:LamG domain-containing protein n=1 Tax=Candidatus Enterococcus avicola TaxID=2838561 RepID=A0A9D2F7I2_9ENTE|nr:LamG domain-containing protein [Candidatus Enterococcus avicola]